MPTSANVAAYMDTRQKYNRPQAIIFCEDYEYVDNPGKEDPDYTLLVPKGTEFENFIILSDHNRAPISISGYRIEQRDRMINGTMRSYHIADKVNISTSWSNLPSRAFSGDPAFNDATGDSPLINESIMADPNGHTADNGAGGVDLLNWYENHAGAFYVLLSYDNYDNFNVDQYGRMNEYSEVRQMFFSDFSYDVIKRGNATFDMWDVSISLEEV
jgi:hypothetical protein